MEKRERNIFELMCQEFKYSGSHRFIQSDEFKGFKVNAGNEAQDGAITSIHTHWMTKYLKMFQWAYHREEMLAINLRLGVMPAAMQACMHDKDKKKLIASTKKLLRLVMEYVVAKVEGFKYVYCGCLEFDSINKRQGAGLHMHAGLIAHGLRGVGAIKAAFYEIRKKYREFNDAYLDFVPFDFYGRTKRKEDRDYFISRGLKIKESPEFLNLNDDVDYEYAIFVFSYHCKKMSKESLMLERNHILTTSGIPEFCKFLSLGKQDLIHQTQIKMKSAANDGELWVKYA